MLDSSLSYPLGREDWQWSGVKRMLYNKMAHHIRKGWISKAESTELCFLFTSSCFRYKKDTNAQSALNSKEN